MADFTHPDVERAEALLRLVMPGRFTVTYTPNMPGRDGILYRWFQVVFTVGSGDSAMLRAQVHSLFPSMLATLAEVRLATQSDLISLRARRLCPDTKNLNSSHPVMFIEADWVGASFDAMRQHGDFSTWAGECLTCRNHFDPADPLTKQYAGQSIA